MNIRKLRITLISFIVPATMTLILSSCSGKSGQTTSQDTAAPATTDSPTQAAASTPAEILKSISGETPDSVYSTPSGLQYIIVKDGDGASPSATDEVSVYYTGMLTDGTVFDSTSAHGDNPISFPLNRVIPGWTEGLQLMKEGGKYVFYIPSDLAYGSQGQPGVIPPDSPLIFEVELVKVGK